MEGGCDCFGEDSVSKGSKILIVFDSQQVLSVIGEVAIFLFF